MNENLEYFIFKLMVKKSWYVIPKDENVELLTYFRIVDPKDSCNLSPSGKHFFFLHFLGALVRKIIWRAIQQITWHLPSILNCVDVSNPYKSNRVSFIFHVHLEG